MNIEKMRKQSVRHLPDNAEKDFDPFSDGFCVEYEEFLQKFSKRMRAKHGKKLKDITSFESRDWNTNIIRIQLVAMLW